jgi:hypothetical protein
VDYHSGGALDRLRHKRRPDGADVVTYEFSIDFEVELSLRTEDAVALGFVATGGAPTLENITTIVPMSGLLTVVNDEHDLEEPLSFENIELTPGNVYPSIARVDDPEQLLLPFDPPYPSASPVGAVVRSKATN